jgi:hypothetical protein
MILVKKILKIIPVKESEPYENEARGFIEE